MRGKKFTELVDILETDLIRFFWLTIKLRLDLMNQTVNFFKEEEFMKTHLCGLKTSTFSLLSILMTLVFSLSPSHSLALGIESDSATSFGKIQFIKNFDVNDQLSWQNSESLIERHRYFFGSVILMQTYSVRYTVTNTGTTPISFKSARISGFEYNAYHTCQRILLPTEKCSFRIDYRPMFEGVSSGMFQLLFHEDTGIQVDVLGQGIRI